MKLLIGISIGVFVTVLFNELRDYLKSNDIQIDWRSVVIVILVIYLIYSIIGIIVSSNVNQTCRGFNYGIHVCTDDNAK